MRSVSYLIGLMGALLLGIAAVVRWRIARIPDEAPPTKKDNQRSNPAAMLLFAAVLLSVIAAIVAVLGWMGR